MKSIQHRFYIFTALSSLGLLVFFILFIMNSSTFIINTSVFALIAFFLFSLLIWLSIQEYRKLNFAKLIIDSSIIQIQTAKIGKKCEKPSLGVISIEASEIYISCFGILLGSRVIKFNVDGISLKEVEIGNDFICLVYSKDKKSESIKLLHETMGEQELQNIVDRFHYETGITPTVIYQSSGI